MNRRVGRERLEEERRSYKFTTLEARDAWRRVVFVKYVKEIGADADPDEDEDDECSARIGIRCDTVGFPRVRCTRMHVLFSAVVATSSGQAGLNATQGDTYGRGDEDVPPTPTPSPSPTPFAAALDKLERETSSHSAQTGE